MIAGGASDAPLVTMDYRDEPGNDRGRVAMRYLRRETSSGVG
jgi:hypothetical protein